VAIALAQSKILVSQTTGLGTITGTLGSTPTANNLLVATVIGSGSGTGWTTPSGWTLASNGGVHADGPKIYYRVVQAGDGKAWSFTESTPATYQILELEEWGGFGGIPTLDLATTAAGVAETSQAVSPGTISHAAELVKTAVGCLGAASSAASWNQGISVDTQFSGFGVTGVLATGQLVTSVVTNFTTTTVTWTGSSSADAGFASWYATPQSSSASSSRPILARAKALVSGTVAHVGRPLLPPPVKRPAYLLRAVGPLRPRPASKVTLGLAIRPRPAANTGYPRRPIQPVTAALRRRPAVARLTVGVIVPSSPPATGLPTDGVGWPIPQSPHRGGLSVQAPPLYGTSTLVTGPDEGTSIPPNEP